MKSYYNYLVLFIFFVIFQFLFLSITYCNQISLSSSELRLAKKFPKQKSASSSSKARKKILKKEKTIKTRKGITKSSIDFEAVDILGKRQVPFGSVITKNNPDKEFELIKIRLDWKPEMILSTNNLETGRIR